MPINGRLGDGATEREGETAPRTENVPSPRRPVAPSLENVPSPRRPVAPSSVLVIGAGFAGLSAATALAERGFRVTVLEGRQMLGGRAYSFSDPQLGNSVDNGQHLFMGCYRETLRFLDRIGTSGRLLFQDNLSVEFAGAQDRGHLRCWPLPSPWHLLSGLLRLKTISWADRFRLIHVHRALKTAAARPASVERLTVEEWLIGAHQSERIRRNLWDPIAIATLNEHPKVASAAPFATVLAQAFFDRRKSSRIGIAGVGLSDLYAHGAKQFIESRGGEVRVKAPVERVQTKDGLATGVRLRDGSILAAEWVVSAASPTAFLKFLPEELRTDPGLQGVAQLKFCAYHFDPLMV